MRRLKVGSAELEVRRVPALTRRAGGILSYPGAAEVQHGACEEQTRAHRDRSAIHHFAPCPTVTSAVTGLPSRLPATSSFASHVGSPAPTTRRCSVATRVRALGRSVPEFSAA